MTDCSFETTARRVMFQSNHGALKAYVCHKPCLRGAGGFSCWDTRHVLFNTPLLGSKMFLIKFDSGSNGNWNDPCNCDKPLISSFSVCCGVYVRGGCHATWQPFSCHYEWTMGDTVECFSGALPATLKTLSLLDLSTCRAPSPATLSTLLLFLAVLHHRMWHVVIELWLSLPLDMSHVSVHL